MAKRSATSQQHPISLAELARRSGKQRSSITRLAQKSLRSAMLPDGRIDASHSMVAAWARGHGLNPRALLAGDPVGEISSRPRADVPARTGAKRRARADAAPTAPVETDEDDAGDPTADDGSEELDPATISRVRDMTLGEVAEKYKTQTRFSGVLKNVKTVEEIRYKFLDNEEQEGRLVPREAIDEIVFGGFDDLFHRFLGDTAKTANLQAGAYAKAGQPEKGEAFVRDLIGSQIRAAKERMLERLKAL